MKYPNQKKIILGHLDDIKHSEKNNGESFLQPTKWEPLKEAMRNLSVMDLNYICIYYLGRAKNIMIFLHQVYIKHYT